MVFHLYQGTTHITKERTRKNMIRILIEASKKITKKPWKCRLLPYRSPTKNLGVVKKQLGKVTLNCKNKITAFDMTNSWQ
jgi:predicted FMN-binding regulatory protein PaiB